jgi:AraC-like DNA-binding protein
MHKSDYSPSIQLIDKNFDRKKFPERFGNEVYLSSITSFVPLTYTSPFSIKYVDTGVEHYKVNGRSNYVKASQVLIINDNSEVTSESHAEEINSAMSIFLDPHLVLDVYESCKELLTDIPAYKHQSPGSLPLFYDNVITDNPALTGFLQCQYDKLSMNSGMELDCSYYYFLAENLLTHQRSFLNYSGKVNKIKAATRLEIVKRTLLAKEILNGTCMNHFDLAELARACALSKFFLIKCFKQVLGTTPNQYFIQQKTAKACELLKKGLPVSEVAAVLNYPNVFSFSRQFRLSSGMTPSAFKSLHCSAKAKTQTTALDRSNEV